jgi:hypothetical protein
VQGARLVGMKIDRARLFPWGWVKACVTKRIQTLIVVPCLVVMANGCSKTVERVSDEVAKSVMSQGLPAKLRAAIAAGEYRCDADGGVESSDGRVSFEIPGGLPVPLGPISDFWSQPLITSEGLTLNSKHQNIFLRLEIAGGLYVRGTGVNDERLV